MNYYKERKQRNGEGKPRECMERCYLRVVPIYIYFGELWVAPLKATPQRWLLEDEAPQRWLPEDEEPQRWLLEDEAAGALLLQCGEACCQLRQG